MDHGDVEREGRDWPRESELARAVRLGPQIQEKMDDLKVDRALAEYLVGLEARITDLEKKLENR